MLLTSTVLLPDVQTRINKLEKSPELSKMVHVSIRAQKTVLPLPEEIQNLAEELAGISEDNSGEDNRVCSRFVASVCRYRFLNMPKRLRLNRFLLLFAAQLRSCSFPRQQSTWQSVVASSLKTEYFPRALAIRTTSFEVSKLLDLCSALKGCRACQPFCV